MKRLLIRGRDGLEAILSVRPRARISKTVLIGAVLAALIPAGLAWATPPYLLTGELLARGTTDARIKIRTRPHRPSDIVVQRITVEPKGDSGWHSHPGPSLIVVTEGVATLYDGEDPSCTPTVFPAGSAFVEEANHVYLVRNEAKAAYQLMVTFVVPEGVPARHDEPDPGSCPF